MSESKLRTLNERFKDALYSPKRLDSRTGRFVYLNMSGARDTAARTLFMAYFFWHQSGQYAEMIDDYLQSGERPACVAPPIHANVGLNELPFTAEMK